MAAMSAYLDMAARYPDDDLELSSVAYLRRGKWTVRHRANPNQSTRRDSPTRRAQKWQDGARPSSEARPRAGREREELATCQNARYLRFAILLHSLLNNLLRPL